MKSLLVLGGTGFFGKSILDVYHAGGLEQWDIGKLILASRNPETLGGGVDTRTNKRVELLKLDVTQEQVYPRAEFVIHAAASTDASKYLISSDAEKRNIQAGTYQFATHARSMLSQSKIVFASSGAVYGQQDSTVNELSEDSVMKDVRKLAENKRDYAAAKRDAENRIERLGKDDGLKVSIARCFAFVGKRLPRNQHFAVGNFLESVLSKKAITVKADHSVVRSYMHSSDLVHWLMSIADAANENCPIYNVGSDDAVELHDLASWMSASYGVPVNMQKISEHKTDRYIPSICKAREELGLSLNTNTFESVAKCVSEIIER